MDEAKARRDEVGRLSRFLDKYSQPRFQLFLILLVTASVGAGASFLLLEAGLTRMWVRYPCAAGVAYLTFLGLLRAWARWHMGHAVEAMKASAIDREGAAEPPRPAAVAETGHRRKRSGWDWNPFDMLDLGSAFDDLPVVIVVVALVIVLITTAGIIVVAPVLLAEVFLDALLVAGLWHRFKRYGTASSLDGAVRATVWPAIVVVACLGVVGFALQMIEPAADSIGDLFRPR